jgi:hypothetical protein
MQPAHALRKAHTEQQVRALAHTAQVPLRRNGGHGRNWSRNGAGGRADGRNHQMASGNPFRLNFHVLSLARSPPCTVELPAGTLTQ